MKIVGNTVKCSEIIISDHRFYLKTAKFLSPPWVFEQKNLVAQGDGYWSLDCSRARALRTLELAANGVGI